MASITLRNIPESVLDQVRILSEAEKRSINSEILLLIEKALSSEKNSRIDNDSFLSKDSQIKIWENLAGSWEDNRSTEEIITDIYSSRTMGRDIDL